jgi:hypothetical protein
MAKEILVLFDRVGNTLDVWFGEPCEAICEEVEEEFLKTNQRTRCKSVS